MADSRCRILGVAFLQMMELMTNIYAIGHSNQLTCESMTVVCCVLQNQ